MFRFTPQQAKKTSSDAGGGEEGGGGEGEGPVQTAAAVVVDTEGKTTESETSARENSDNLEKPMESETTGSEPGCDTIIGTSYSSAMKNNTEIECANSESSTSSSTEAEKGTQAADISNDDNSSETLASESSTAVATPAPTLSSDANDKTNQECMKESVQDVELPMSSGEEREAEDESVKAEGTEFDSERLDISESEAKNQTAGGDEANVSQSAGRGCEEGEREEKGEAGEVVLIENAEGENECTTVRTNDTQGEGAAGDGVNIGNLEVSTSSSSKTAEDVDDDGKAMQAGEIEGKQDGGSKEQVSSEENIEVIQEAIEMSFDEENPTEPPVTDENVNNSEEPMETDELFDGVDDDKQEERQSNENGDFSGASSFSCSAPGNTDSCNIQPDTSSSPSQSITGTWETSSNLFQNF